ncbi:hypothetical protein JMUB7523_26260 [Staphylococcus aureus]
MWKAESQFAVLEEAAQRRQLSAQEKSLLAHKDETLEYKRQLAALGDKVTYQAVSYTHLTLPTILRV